MEGNFIKINEWLTPLSWLYGAGVKFRNFLFDSGVLKSRAYGIDDLIQHMNQGPGRCFPGP